MNQYPSSVGTPGVRSDKVEKKTSVLSRKGSQRKESGEDGQLKEKEGWEDFFINPDNQQETVKFLVSGVRKCLELIFKKNSQDGTHPKATYGFPDRLPEVKKTYERGSFPKQGIPEEETMKLFFDSLVMGINPGSPTYMGHMLPSLNRMALVSGTIASLLNQNMIAHEVAPVFTQMENQVISYLADLIGYDTEKSGGAIVSGGTTANHTALLVARNRKLPGIEKHGAHKALDNYNETNNTDYKNFVLFVGEDAHYSIEKLAGYIGVGSDQVRVIPFREGSHSDLDIDALYAMIHAAEKNKELVIGISITAGTTEKGTVHNIKEVLGVAKHRPQNKEIYVHVDAAHGGGFLANDRIKGEYFEGIQNADSVTIDGHKMFYTNYGCGGIIFKDQQSLGYIKQSAPYVLPENTENENHGSYTIEGSRGTAGLTQLWTAMKLIGKDGYSDMMHKLVYKTKVLNRSLKDDDTFEVLGEPELNVLCFRYVPKSYLVQGESSINEFNEKLKQKLLQDGNYYLSDTCIEGKTCFRAVIMNLTTEEHHIQGLIAKLHELSAEILDVMKKEAEKNSKKSIL